MITYDHSQAGNLPNLAIIFALIKLKINKKGVEKPTLCGFQVKSFRLKG
jgi:hypothetical protein